MMHFLHKSVLQLPKKGGAFLLIRALPIFKPLLGLDTFPKKSVFSLVLKIQFADSVFCAVFSVQYSVCSIKCELLCVH